MSFTLDRSELYFNHTTISNTFRDGTSVTNPRNKHRNDVLGVYKDKDGDWRSSNNRTFYLQGVVLRRKHFKCQKLSGKRKQHARKKQNGNGGVPTFRGVEPSPQETLQRECCDDRSTCDDCGSVFKSDRALEDHQRALQHGPFESFECDDCGKEFPSENAVQDHQRAKRHGPFRVFECHDCWSEFTSKQRLRQHHRAKNHGPVCFDCGKKFSSSRSREQHQQSVGHGEFDEEETTTSDGCTDDDYY
jgi:DNA-directed RNA polymerase subunit RPC12/RpoP